LDFVADLLQSIAIMMMEPPNSLDDDSLRSNKVDLLKSIPPVESSDLVLGQYAAGPHGKAYVNDDTVPDDSRTATFAQWAMKVDNERWRGVPVMVKCGKGNSSPPYAMSLSISHCVTPLCSSRRRINDDDFSPSPTSYQRVQGGRTFQLACHSYEPGTGGIFQIEPLETSN
jgi:glucose-6-phosphate 1-dehydrogenase